MNPQYILILVVTVIMGWFAFGVIYNLRRGNAILKWMQKGLPRIGPRTTFRWLGTSVVELGIAHAKRPFRRLEILLVLAPRDVFWLAIMAALQGRRDIIIFRAQLNTPPLLNLELADPKTWSGRTALKQVAERGWESQPYGDMQLMAPKGLLNMAASTLNQIAASMQRLAPRYVRLGLRKEMPNLEIHLPFPDRNSITAEQYFEALSALARVIGDRD